MEEIPLCEESRGIFGKEEVCSKDYRWKMNQISEKNKFKR